MIEHKEEIKKSSDEVVISEPKEPIIEANKTKPVDMPAVDGETLTPGEPEIPAEKPTVDIFTKEFCGTIWEMLFSKLAATKGDHWKLTEAEKLTIGETTSAVANKYIGDLMDDYPELAALGISVAVIAVPRVLEDGRIKRANKQLADGAISKAGGTEDPSLSSVSTDKKQPGNSSKKEPSTS